MIFEVIKYIKKNEKIHKNKKKSMLKKVKKKVGQTHLF